MPTQSVIIRIIQRFSKLVSLAVLPFVYPVGCIYFSTNSTNPSVSLGFGTWAAFGAGKVPVGFLNADPDFGTDEVTGGEKTHALTNAEVPNNITVTTGTVAGAALNVQAANHSATPGGAHNNLQPFIVVRMWKRTA
jgi:hypothetical protein